ncbi:malto-oligosyltrehalose trehalohydrolase [Pulveribacter suum]|uniref:Malto-oligosyltrehalose trehalohydrolase n=1 Tax=Pulveribacter suum TaxID=2116657 RepID=A0A2P1NLH3_9BURK|nr:malto-oligosyltrehalose trehalohydrolase [Pulveribacter suum]AVP57836.1 malto-oligosyltrehalose trehalohydrolase [Pulveribacter suum]
MKHRHDMPFGAQPDAQGTDFSLWAPAARHLVLRHRPGDEGPWQEQAAVSAQGGWWRCTLPQAGAGTRYQWLVDGTAVPDPASGHNPHGPHGASVVVDPCAFDWQHAPPGRPWSDVVLYELHIGTFTPEGSFAAAARRLPALRALGFTAIELMPVAAFGGSHGWGYDGVLPFAPHAGYGTPEDFKRLIDAAHGLGLMVFLDVVYNHFGPDGNYLGQYAPQFFSQEHESPWGKAINFDGEGSATVREFFIHNALYWAQEYQIDGLRLDAVHAIVDDGERHFLQELSQRVRAAAGDRPVHLVLENERNEGERLAATPLPGRFDGQWNDDFHHALHVLLTGETRGYYHDYGNQPLARLAHALTHGYVFAPAPRQEGRRTALAPAQPQPLGAMVNFVGNHDQVGNRAFGERLATLVEPPVAELALLLSLLGPAIPLVFMGDEFGARTPFLYFAGWEGELRDAVREGRKREFGHALEHARAGRTELPDPCAAQTLADSRLDWALAESQGGLARQALVRQALAARARWIAPRHGLLLSEGHSAQAVGDTGLLVRWHYADGRQLVLELNLGGTPVSCPACPSFPGETIFQHARSPSDDHWPAWSARWTLSEPQA